MSGDRKIHRLIRFLNPLKTARVIRPAGLLAGLIFLSGCTAGFQGKTGFIGQGPAVVKMTAVKSIIGEQPKRQYHTAVWTGKGMIVFGGTINGISVKTGYVYNPETNMNTPISVVGGPSARHMHSAIWTGSRMIVYGGANFDGRTYTTLGDGYVYDPYTDKWKQLTVNGAPSQRFGHSAVWTGSQMLVFGGTVAQQGKLVAKNDLAVWDSATNKWSIQKPKDNAWPTPRFAHSAVWTGSEMILSGGAEVSSGGYKGLADFWSYDPQLKYWINVRPSGDTPGPRLFGKAIWNGTAMVIVGGAISMTEQAKSVVPVPSNEILAGYNPKTEKYVEFPKELQPLASMIGHSAVWTGKQMIFWDGATITDSAKGN